MKKIVICGGHLTPALALIEKFEKEKELEIIFFGRKHSTEGVKNLSAEYIAIKKLNIKFVAINGGRLQRRFTKYTIPSLLKIPVGFIQSFASLLSTRPTLVVSFGGYLSLPVVFSAWLLGIKSITHEQSSILGLANKINSYFVKKTYLSWPQTVREVDKNRSVIGNLTRAAIFKVNAQDTRVREFLKTSQKLIFVTGGNQGSHFINQLIFELLPRLSGYQVLHQVGTANHMGDLGKAQKIKKTNYLAIDYIGQDDIGAIFDKADLVISRSGANTVWDLAILGKVAILIPLPIAASDEQLANAHILENARSAIILNQTDTTLEVLKQKIEYIFKNLPKFQKSAQTFAKTLPKNATQILTSEILKLIED